MSEDGLPPDIHDALRIDCNICLATGTTACGDCVVGHVLANDGGPIELVVASRPEGDTERVVRLMARAGLLDDPPVFVSPEEFAATPPHPPPSRPTRLP
jgi:hypothetical protein